VQRGFNLRGQSIPTPEPRPSSQHAGSAHTPSESSTPTRDGNVSDASESQQPPSIYNPDGNNNATGIDEISILNQNEYLNPSQFQPSTFQPFQPH